MNIYEKLIICNFYILKIINFYFEKISLSILFKKKLSKKKK